MFSHACKICCFLILLAASKSPFIAAERRAYVTVITSDADVDAAIVMGASLFASTRNLRRKNEQSVTTDYVSLILPSDQHMDPDIMGRYLLKANYTHLYFKIP